MQSLIILVAVYILACALVWAINNGYNIIAYLRKFVKRLALYVISFSWIIVLTAMLILACYSNISNLLKDVLSSNDVNSIKGLIRFIFGVDSAFTAMQMLAFYSLMASFVSCLAFSIGLGARFVYKTILKTQKSTFVDDGQCLDNFSQYTVLPFKSNLKYNS